MGRSTANKNELLNKQESKIGSYLANKKQIFKESEKKSRPPVYQLLLAYSNYFINPVYEYKLKTKSAAEEKQLAEYIKHCFQKYKVCYPLFNVWFGNQVKSKQFDKNVKMYICQAQGGSLYKEHLKDTLTKKEVHNLVNCRHNILLDEAFVYSAAKAETDNDAFALKIARTKIKEYALTDYWKGVVYFFARSQNYKLDVQSINDIVDFLRVKLAGGHPYPLNGHTVESLKQRVHEWHADLSRIKKIGEHVWDGIAIDDFDWREYNSKEDITVSWDIVQIKTSKQLAQEGNKMRHCVFSYRDYCIKGTSSIWSLGKYNANGLRESKVTIELRTSNLTVVQTRGFANRKPSASEDSIIKKWISKNGLSYSGW